MEILAIVLGILALVALYFCFGIVVKFVWGWWILLLAVPFCLFIGIWFHWLGAAGSVVAFVAAIAGNNAWHDVPVYLEVEARLDKAFYFKDT